MPYVPKNEQAQAYLRDYDNFPLLQNYLFINYLPTDIDAAEKSASLSDIKITSKLFES